MSSITRGLAAIALAVVVLATGLPALAEGPDTSTAPPEAEPLLSLALGSPEGFWERYDAIAEALGMTPEDLFAELHAGNTVAQVAKGRGVTMEELAEALGSAREERVRERIESLMAEGTVEEHEGGWLLEGLENGWLGRLVRRVLRDVREHLPRSLARLAPFRRLPLPVRR